MTSMCQHRISTFLLYGLEGTADKVIFVRKSCRGAMYSSSRGATNLYKFLQGNLEVLFNSTSDSLFAVTAAMISSCCRNNLISNSSKLRAVMDMIENNVDSGAT